MGSLQKPDAPVVYLTMFVEPPLSTPDGEFEALAELCGVQTADEVPEKDADLYAEYVPIAALDEVLQELRDQKAFLLGAQLSRSYKEPVEFNRRLGVMIEAADAVLAKHADHPRGDGEGG